MFSLKHWTIYCFHLIHLSLLESGCLFALDVSNCIHALSIILIGLNSNRHLVHDRFDKISFTEIFEFIHEFVVCKLQVIILHQNSILLSDLFFMDLILIILIFDDLELLLILSFFLSKLVTNWSELRCILTEHEIGMS